MTEHITISRELLRQALEAIELNWKTDEGDAVKPLLRSALEQPAVEPTQPQWRKKGTGPWWDGLPDPSDGGGPYETRILFAAPQAQQEKS